MRWRNVKNVEEVFKQLKILIVYIIQLLSLTIFSVKLDVESDPLKWWKLHALSHPLLSNVSKKYLAIPATSASSERLFSRSGKIATPLRASLKPDKVNMLEFLSKNV